MNDEMALWKKINQGRLALGHLTHASLGFVWISLQWSSIVVLSNHTTICTVFHHTYLKTEAKVLLCVSGIRSMFSLNELVGELELESRPTRR